MLLTGLGPVFCTIEQHFHLYNIINLINQLRLD